VPDDGRVVTISTNPRRRNNNNNNGNPAADQLASASQTSLLIEYFESGKKDKTKNPSVRVKVTPSRRSKSKGSATDDVRSQRSSNSPNILGEVFEGRRRESGNLTDGMSFVSGSSVQPLN